MDYFMKIVNIEEAKKEFVKFAETYDLSNIRINRKKYHSLRVTELSKTIAEKENFNEEEIEIATLIGLLHDIARFKQFTEYQTFEDAKSIDHGDVGVEILEKDNYIRKYIETEKYDRIIKLAIKNHNKFKIEDGLTEEENKFCKLIRDADKIDILAQRINFWDEETASSKLNPEVKKVFDEQKTLQRSKYKKIEHADKVIQYLGFIFDLNYKSSFKIIKEEKYIEQMVSKFKFKDEYTQKSMLEAGEKVKQYILNKIEE